MNRLGAGSLATVVVAAALAACTQSTDEPLRLYTTVTQETVDAVVAGFTEATGHQVEVLRLPTGELNARIASELRTDGLTADVLWLTDPLSMHQYEADGLLATWEPDGADRISPDFRTPSTWGTRILNLVIVAGNEVNPMPTSWDDLPNIPGPVALPDPGFAGSAFAALAYFSQTEGFGYFEALHDAGAIQVQSPGEVVTGVAEGRFTAGITLDFAARAAVGNGSPIHLIWPEPGAIAFHSPIGAVASSSNDAARAFVEYVLSDEGQRRIGESGWQPVIPGLGGPEPAGDQVTIAWTDAASRQSTLLATYRDLFGG
ncbi:MAG: extracellular solute-binding protein [Acidimicrobiia bacterium]